MYIQSCSGSRRARYSVRTRLPVNCRGTWLSGRRLSPTHASDRRRQCRQAQRQTGSRTFQALCPLQQVLQLPGQGVHPAMPLFPVPGIPAASVKPSMPLCRPCCNGFRAVSAGLHAPVALGSAVLQPVFQPTEVMESFQWMVRTSPSSSLVRLNWVYSSHCEKP